MEQRPTREVREWVREKREAENQTHDGTEKVSGAVQGTDREQQQHLLQMEMGPPGTPTSALR